MKFFLDSAKIDEIREAYETFGIDGITTNPNHIMNSGKPFSRFRLKSIPILMMLMK